LFEGAGWVYEEPYEEAGLISGRIAFWREVGVTGMPEGSGLVENEARPRAATGRAGRLCAG